MKTKYNFPRLFVLILFTAAGFASLAQAGVVGTPHDLRNKGSSRNVCSYCHVPHNAVGDKIWSDFGNEAQLVNGPSTKIGNMCYTCHDGTVTSVGNKSVFNKAKQQHIMPAGKDCDMCHTVHDNTNENFMGVPKTGGTGETHYATYCETCHAGSTMQEDAAYLGDHTAGVQHSYEFGGCNLCHMAHGAAQYTPSTGDVTHPILRSSNEDSALCQMCHGNNVSNNNGKIHPANLGSAGEWGKVSCESCHDPHQSDVNDDRPFILLENPQDSKFCLTCHQESDSAKGPGIGQHSHPINITLDDITPLDTSKAPLGNEIDDNNKGGPDYPNNSATVVCETCHSVHRKGEARPLLRLSANAGELCINCHNDK